ncbi:hypothetical protein [Flavobacterium sp.]|uniref:hypothetical protein n=1 Tax=Flavobacterium sp. TaxID=239 RepID=UPI00286A9237|nr:hypothetical protein [Flavobacterium sp.]
MKKNVFKIGLVSMILIGIVSCNNKEKELADKRIGELESFVDSLETISASEREANWDKISEDFENKELNANDATINLDKENKLASQAKIDASTTKYNEFNLSIEANKLAAIAKPSSSQLLRDRLFGAGKIGADMSFTWVNKDNILNVYDTFFQSYKDNKSDFSREDYDEIKLMYEALDSRKNTVEKEGLSASDNTKIASIKFKFAPMFKMNRIGAKSRETAAAKE